VIQKFRLKQYDDVGCFGYGDGELIRLRMCVEKEAGFNYMESQLPAVLFIFRWLAFKIGNSNGGRSGTRQII
jgi:hypothetical protein